MKSSITQGNWSFKSLNDITNASEEMTTPKVKPAFKIRRNQFCNHNNSEDDYDNNESTLTTEGESDYYSWRKSSINSESDFARSPHDKTDTFDSILSTLNPEVKLNRSECTETECTSHNSSTVDSSDTDEGKE